ncbi:MAG: translocation/assembly module TamB domain-containing protein [Xanthomonadales bacterium]|nr:translocation/assembly module TamB domain-containing protein [Xanthomonadales bacterium]
MTTTAPAKHRLRRLLWLFVLILPLVLALLLVWALRSGSARDLALAQVQAALGADALQWQSAEGALTGGLVLEGVRWQGDGVMAQAQRLELDLSALALLRGDVQLRTLKLSDAIVQWPVASDDAEPWPQRIELPSRLPALILPVDVRVDALSLQRVRLIEGDASVLDIHDLNAAASLVGGRVRVPHLRLDSDRLSATVDADFDSVRAWRGAIKAQLALAIPDAEPLPITLGLNGPQQDIRLDAQADLGAPANLELRVRGGLASPKWTLDVDAPQIDATRLGMAAQAMALNLKAHGDLGQAEFEGMLKHGAFELGLAPSRVSYQDASLRLAPLALSLLGGEASAKGEIRGDGAQPVMAIDLQWSGLKLPAAEDGASVQTHGQARLDGSIEDYALTSSSRWVRAKDEALVELKGRGSTHAMQVDSLTARLPNGGLQAKGDLVWEPQLAARLEAELKDFDPSYFVPDLPGSIDAALRVDGGLDDAGVASGEVVLDELSGQLRGQRVSGHARARANPRGEGEGQVELALADSRLAAEGRWGKTFALDAQLHALDLATLLADAQGRIEGTLALRGTRQAPQLEAQLSGHDLALADNRVDTLQLKAQLDAREHLSLDLDAQSLTLAGQRFDRLLLEGEGERGAHRLKLALDGEPGRAAVELSGGLDAKSEHWQGRLESLGIEPGGQPHWQLREAATMALDLKAATLELQRACLDAAPAFACATVTRSGSDMRADLALEGFDLAQWDELVQSALARPASVSGTLAATAQLESHGDAWAGHAELRIPTLSLTADDNGQNTTVGLRDFALTAQFDPAEATVTVLATPGEQGHLRARLHTATPFAEDGSLTGEVDVLWPDLAVAGLFTEDVVNPSGRMETRLALAGTRLQPSVDGTLELIDFAAEVPALGIKPSEGHVVLSSAEAGHLEVSGTLKLGEGMLRLDGQLDRNPDGSLGGRMGVKGEALTVADIPEAKLSASPDLSLELAGQKLTLRGSVVVPFARIDLERMESVVAPSSDVVVVDGPPQSQGLTLDSDISVQLGDDVRLSGFGLKGTLAGKLRLRDRPGRATTARGSIDVGGKYKAYGQDLTITRGQIAWAGTPLDTPSLDIRAERKIDAITVGVQVRGSATTPELSLWSKPAMEQAEQLSYLVLGRPLRSATQAEGGQLSQAAAALGGNLLAKSLGARLGLDEVEVADNRALGGAALTVGMYLSPRLHVSYGMALFGTGQVITFKYLINRLWNIQLDSGSEDRINLNYRLER